MYARDTITHSRAKEPYISCLPHTSSILTDNGLRGNITDYGLWHQFPKLENLYTSFVLSVNLIQDRFLSDNRIYGEMPKTILKELLRISLFHCANCDLSGELPEIPEREECYLKELYTCHQFNDCMHLFIARILPENFEIVGELPPALWNCPNLTHVSFTNTSLTGEFVIEGDLPRHIEAMY